MSTAASADPRRPATILHTSDCHLAGYNGGREEPAFAKAIDLAIREQVDAVLITGDLFDHARVPDSLLDWTVAELDRLALPVVMIPGNHDVFDERSVHHRFTVADRCANVQFIDAPDGHIVEIPGTDVVVWGRAMPEHEPDFRPLTGVPPRPTDRWSIAAGHGLIMDGDEPTFRSSPIYESDLAAVHWDYVALGHIHRYSVVRDAPTPVRYAGATASSLDGLPGVVLVDFVPGSGAHPRWVALPVDEDTPRANRLPSDFEGQMDLATVDHLLSTTRAVRKRLDLKRPVPHDVIVECLRLAIQAPTGSNAQRWRWIVVTDPNTRSLIAELYRNPRRVNAPTTDPPVELSPQQQRVMSSARYLTEHVHEVPVLIVPCIEDAGGAAGWAPSIYPAVWSLQLALRSRGLGSCITTVHLFRKDESAALLGIPDGFVQACLVPVAYYTGDDFRPAVRRPIEEITYWNRWGNTEE